MKRLKLSQKQRHWLDFLFVMTQKEIKTRYKRTVLGLSWAIFNPLSQMLIIGLIFQFFVPMKIENYFLYLFAGLLPWNFFVNAVLRATPLLVQERALIQKAAFPRELMIVSVVLANLFHTLLASLVFLLFLSALQSSLLLGIVFFFSRLFLTFFLFTLLTIFVLAVSLIVSALYVKIRDLNFIVQLGLQLMFYTVPVIYSLEMMPSQLIKLISLNPILGYVETLRSIVLGSNFNYGLFIYSLITSFVLLFLSLIFFKKESKNFDDWF